MSALGRSSATVQAQIRPLALGRFSAIPLDPTTRLPERSRSSATPGGGNNTAIGNNALLSNTIGNFNTAIGGGALVSNTDGGANTATGALALFSNITGGSNTAIGFAALQHNTVSNNTAIGFGALNNNDTGTNNTAIGAGAGSSITVGTDNISIGNGVSGVAGESDTIRIGDNLPAGPGDSACYIGGIQNQIVAPASAVTVQIDIFGKLGTLVSSKRFKHDIKPMDKSSEAILALKPVTFHYKSDAKNTPCFGLIAEEVAAVDPDLMVRDKKGEISSVRYDAVNAMLLNEFLKEHGTVQELKKEIATLTATVKEQAAQIQKVSAQIEVRTSGPHVVKAP